MIWSKDTKLTSSLGAALMVTAVAYAAIGLGAVSSALGASPSSGTIGPPPDPGSVSWEGPDVTANTAGPSEAQCTAEVAFCDDFSLTVNSAQSQGSFNVRLDGFGVEDVDVYVYDRNGTEVGRSAEFAGLPESATVECPSLAASPYKVRVVYFTTVDDGDPATPGYSGRADYSSTGGCEPTGEPTGDPTDGPIVFEGTGDISVGDPATGVPLGAAGFQGGVTENDFRESCPTPPRSQGFDGHVFELPGVANGGDGFLLKGSGSGTPYDLDAAFYDFDCNRLLEFATESPDETGWLPDRTKYVVANLALGAETTASLTVFGELGEPQPVPVVTPPAPTRPRGTYPSEPNDPLFADQWGMAKIQAPEAWQEPNATGYRINIAIVDSGVDIEHEDFACPDKLAVLPGSNIGTDETPQDEDGHGTHVAGIAAACTNNGRGVVGVAPDATLMPVSSDGVDDLDESMAEGIRFATDRGAHVINLSIGPRPPESHTGADGYPLTEEALEHARSNGVVIAAAAGNFVQPTCEYPSLSRNVICVVATDRNDLRTWYTDFPVNVDRNADELRLEPAVAAPGGLGPTFGALCEEEIVSTYLRTEGSVCYSEGYDSLSGTSMSSPHVAGLAALLYDRIGGERSRANADTIVQTILDTSDDLYTDGWDPIVGHGRINALRAVQAIEVPPEPRPDLQVTHITAGNNRSVRQGEKVTITAIVSNPGTAAAASKTQFSVDGSPLPGGVVSTPAIPESGSVQVSMDWDTRGVKGEHTIAVHADSGNGIEETSEENNRASLTVTVQGNRVQNGSFEQSANGSSPDSWSSSGPTAYEGGGSDGSRSVSAEPGGSWTSAAVPIEPGRSYEASVLASGAGSTLVVQQLASDGALLASSAQPLLATSAFTLTSLHLDALAGAAKARIVLLGGLSGKTSFDDVGLFSA